MKKQTNPPLHHDPAGGLAGVVRGIQVHGQGCRHCRSSISQNRVAGRCPVRHYHSIVGHVTHTLPSGVLFRFAGRQTTGGREPIGLHLPNRVVCGRARCERWPRPGLHPTQRTRIETHLSRINSSWSSIQSSFSEHLSRPPTGVGLMGARPAH